jgi:hypothetical protein
MRATLLLSTVATALALAGAAAQAETVKKEPPMGALKPGQVVLVDDGRCPAGQVMRVTGGDHVKVGGKKQIERQRTCVKK